RELVAREEGDLGSAFRKIRQQTGPFPAAILDDPARLGHAFAGLGSQLLHGFFRSWHGDGPHHKNATPRSFALRHITRHMREGSPLSNTRLNSSGMPTGLSTPRQAPVSERLRMRQFITARPPPNPMRATLEVRRRGDIRRSAAPFQPHAAAGTDASWEVTKFMCGLGVASIS